MGEGVLTPLETLRRKICAENFSASFLRSYIMTVRHFTMIGIARDGFLTGC